MKRSARSCALLFFGPGALFAMSPASADSPPANRVPFQDAQKAALTKVTGKVESAGLEQQEGMWIYTFEVRGAKGALKRIEIDAMTGAVVPDSGQKKH